jgi:hypothetical protein
MKLLVLVTTRLIAAKMGTRELPENGQTARIKLSCAGPSSTVNHDTPLELCLDPIIDDMFKFMK